MNPSTLTSKSKGLLALSAFVLGFLGCAQITKQSESRQSMLLAAPAPAREIDPFPQGKLNNTGRQLDVAIQGAGFFCVKLPKGQGNQVVYTRSGNFFRTQRNHLVLGVGDGCETVPPITIPSDLAHIEITDDGRVRGVISEKLVTFGRLTLTIFQNPLGLKRLACGLYAPAPEAGRPLVGKAKQAGFGWLAQSYLESANGANAGAGGGAEPLTDKFDQGALNNTGRNLDIGIQGSGYFRVIVPAAEGGGFAYTRSGNLVINDKSHLMVNVGHGYEIDPCISIPVGLRDLDVCMDGIITGFDPARNKYVQVGSLTLTQFINPQGLKVFRESADGENFCKTLYRVSDESGDPITQEPGKKGAGNLLQNYLEVKN